MLTQEYLKECLVYNPETGELRWKERPESHFKDASYCFRWNKRRCNTLAGSIVSIKGKSYTKVCVNYQPYFTHRLIWFYVHGEWPDTIDHIDGNGLNNRLDNLRNVSLSENNKNYRRSKRNKSGFTGVSWVKKDKMWTATLQYNGEFMYLGLFKNKNDAAIVRGMKEYELGFHANHGTDR